MKSLLIVLFVVGAALGVARLQPRLAMTLHDTKSREDVYVLPPPNELKVMDLGYDAATVDLLWAKVMVEYGIHHQEKRAFPDLDKYVDAIMALEPKYKPLYKYVDTLLVYRPPRGWEADARKVRQVLENGTRELPDDGQVWLEYGDFLSFLAPTFLTSEDEIQQWRREGADALLKAVMLGSDSMRALSAASLLGKRGEREQQIRHLQKSYQMTDDPEVQERIAIQLEALQERKMRDKVERHRSAIGRECQQYASFLTGRACLLVGPFPSAAACAGPAAGTTPACARTWASLLQEVEARYGEDR